MDFVIDERRECELRIEAAMEMLELSSERFRRAAFSGRRDAVEIAYADLRFARVRFKVATEAYKDTLQLMA